MLEGLNSGQVAELITSHAGHEAAASVVSAVHEQTDGNPFFVEEVMRHLIETGLLFERGGRWGSALTADEIGVPEAVKDVLQSRLARLSDGCRTVLAQAAVLGREFSFDVLAAMAEHGDEEVIAALEEAAAAQLIVEEPTGGSTHAFSHALVREAIYGGLSTPRRQRLHARAAQAIEAIRGDELGHCAGNPLPAGRSGRRRGQGDRVLAARRKRGARALRMGGGGRSLGRGAGRHGARRRAGRRTGQAAGRCLGS